MSQIDKILIKNLGFLGERVEVESDDDIVRIDDHRQSHLVGGHWQSVGEQFQKLEQLRRLVDFLRQIGDEDDVENGATAGEITQATSGRRRTQTLVVGVLRIEHNVAINSRLYEELITTSNDTMLLLFLDLRISSTRVSE